ncbi:MAG: ferritin [Bacteroidetes bacterium]|jgi:ferritin|nr:ferritin [Bacteroidota bacterium]
MPISSEIQKLLNDQINLELHSANQYLCIASHFIDEELVGIGNFFLLQSQEENGHAMKQFDYLHAVGGKFALGDLKAPEQKFGGYLDVFRLALKLEERVTASIYNIVDQAQKQKDFATYTFFEWFVTEQVEEESTLHQLIRKLEMIGDNTSALFLFDQELGSRKAGA